MLARLVDSEPKCKLELAEEDSTNTAFGGRFAPPSSFWWAWTRVLQMERSRGKVGCMRIPVKSNSQAKMQADACWIKWPLARIRQCAAAPAVVTSEITSGNNLEGALCAAPTLSSLPDPKGR